MRACRILISISILVLCAGIALASTPSGELAERGMVTIKFQPGSVEAPNGVLVSDGSKYSADRGYGWDRDIKGQARKRADGCTGIAFMDRAISLGTFTIDLPNGDYIFEVTARDSEFTGGLAILLDGIFALPPVQLRAGDSITQTVPVKSTDGKARISFLGGQQGRPNSVVGGIMIIPASADMDKWRQISNTVNAYQKSTRDRVEAKQSKRVNDRAAYKALSIRPSSTPRQIVDLAGKWLFMPSQDLGDASAGADPKISDRSWHVLGVPQFWNPTEWWIYTSVNGTSHNYLRKEIERCEAFTFDYDNTSSGWYRQWIEVPANMKGKRFILKFDAVASMAQVYWNGKPVRNHVGMFGPFECEVTPYVKFGDKNLLAVMVAGSKTDPQAAKDVAAVAVTVNVTKEMLNSLPHGCYKAGMSGIWQPARLEITSSDRIADVYFRPRLDGATIETEISRQSSAPLEVRHTLLDNATARPLKGGSAVGKVTSEKVITVLNGLTPKLWSPEHPNLYRLRTQLLANGKIVDEKITTVGFKTFEALGNRLYLNGKPYFVRGADQPPHGLEPNNKQLADKFMKLMHDGNTMVTRFHVAPPSQLWLDAADKQGVGSSVGEDWPWVLIDSSPLPDRKVLDVWKTEFQELVRANRNHPSMMLWTISNESYFQGDPDEARRLEKYRIFSDVIKSVRALSPDVPIVLHSGYARNKDYYEKTMKPNDLDDGDVDDGHFYFGWYEKHPYRVNVPTDIERRSQTERPFISQEASTGYPDNDTGHPVESYIRDHVVPQAWVGRYGTYAERPENFLDTHAQITKEYAEKIRRDRTRLAGWMIFANTCWFKDVYDAERITPYPVYQAMQKAWQPVLISLGVPKRHFEAGDELGTDLIICNDDPDRPILTDLTARWHIYGKSSAMGTSGSVKVPDCKYDQRVRALVSLAIPTDLPQERADMTLALELYQGEEFISRNDYPLVCTTKDWYKADGSKLLVLEKTGSVRAYLSNLGFKCESMQTVDFRSLPVDTVVVTGPTADTNNMLDPMSDFVRRGGRVLMIEPPVAGVPDLPADKKSVEVPGDFADVLVPELLDGMSPMDMHWWNAEPSESSVGVPRVCRTSYQFSEDPQITKLVQHIQPHGYLKAGQLAGYVSWPVFERRTGEGRMIVSSMRLTEDPLSKRFTANLVRYLTR